MPFRDVTLPTGEVVRARVSDEAIADWLRDRDWLRGRSVVDRPPDWDDGPSRGWLPHVSAGEGDHPYWRGIRASAERLLADPSLLSQQPVVSYVWNTGVMLVKFIVSERSDGSFHMRHSAVAIVAVPGPDGTTAIHEGHDIVPTMDYVIAGDVDPVVAGNDIEMMVVNIDGSVMLAARKPIVPDVHVAAETADAQESEYAAARADVVAEYGWAPWAEPLLGKAPAKEGPQP